MKTIKIFIASSNELEKERVLMASLANELSTRLEKVGIQVIAVEWESLDASMGEDHKQEDYNKKLRECDMCMVLYWTKFGMYTEKELNTAYHEKISGKNPQKVWVYFKEIDDPSNMPTEELKAFRDSFPTKYGHFYTPFANFDTLKAHFLLQFMEYQSQDLQGKSIVEVKDGKVTVDGKEYVDLQNVPFAGNNEEYQLLQKNLKKTRKLLAVTEIDDPEYVEYTTEIEEMEEKLTKMEFALWDTAIMITRLSSTKCSERLQRAMDLFNQGNNKGAQAILNEEEIEKDIQHNLNLIKLGEEGKKGLKTNIDEYLLKIQTYEIEGYYEEQCQLSERIIELSISLYGGDSIETADAYNRLGKIHNTYRNYKKALEYYKKTLAIRKESLGDEHRDTATSYNDIGIMYLFLKDYEKAEKYFTNALRIRENRLGQEDSDTATSYNCIGYLYDSIKDYDKALEYYSKALDIRKIIYGIDHPSTATLYHNIGLVFYHQKKFDKALEYYSEALDIRKKNLDKHPYTADTYYSIGSIYRYRGDYDNALDNFSNALEIRKKVLGLDHPDTKDSLKEINNIKQKMSNL